MKQCPRCKTYLFEDMGICYKCLCEFEDVNGATEGVKGEGAAAARDSCALDLGEWVVLATAHMTRGSTAPSPDSFMALPLGAGEAGEGEEPVLRLSLEVRKREGGAMAGEPRPPWEPALSYPTISS